MKKILTFFAVLLLAVTAWAQNPKLSYQAVVRDNSNRLVTNSNVDVTISVLRTDNSPQYTQDFSNVPTNQNGLFSLLFGGEAGWDDVSWLHSKIAVAITLPDHSVVKDTTEVNAVPLAINTMYSQEVDPSSLVQSDWTETDTEDPSYIKNKPNIPAIIATYVDTSSHFQSQVGAQINDTLNNRYNAAALCDSLEGCISGGIADYLKTNHYLDSATTSSMILDSVHTYVHDTLTSVAGALNDRIDGIVTIGGEPNVNADWEATSGDAEIFNKPNIPAIVGDYIDSSSHFVNSIVTNIDTNAAIQSQIVTVVNDTLQNGNSTLNHTVDTIALNTVVNYLDTTSTVPSTEALEALANRVNTFNTNVCDSVAGCLAGSTDLQNAINNFLDSSSVYHQNFIEDFNNYTDSSSVYNAALATDIHNYIDSSSFFDQSVVNDITSYIDSSKHYVNSIITNIDTNSSIQSQIVTVVNDTLKNGSSVLNHTVDTIALNTVVNYLDTTSTVPSTEALEALADRVNTFNTNVCDSVAGCLESSTTLQNAINNFLDSSSVYHQNFIEDFTNYTDSSSAYNNALTTDIQNYIDSSRVYNTNLVNDIHGYIDSSSFFDQSVVNNINNYMDTTSTIPGAEALEVLSNRVDVFNTHVCDSVAGCLEGSTDLQNAINNFLDSSSVFNQNFVDNINSYVDSSSHFVNTINNIVDSSSSIITTLNNYIDSSSHIANAITNYIDSSSHFVNSIVTNIDTNANIQHQIVTVVNDTLRNGNSALNHTVDTIAMNTIVNYLDTTTTIPGLEELEALAGQVSTNTTNIDGLQSALNGYAKLDGSNTYTGTNDFTGGTTTVASGFTFGTTTTETCGNVAVNACDLLNVFDSLYRRMSDIQENLQNQIDSLKAILDSSKTNPVNLGLTGTPHSTSIDVAARISFGGSPITSREFCYVKADMTDTTCVFSNSNEKTLEGLESNTEYYVWVKATNEIGTSTSEPVLVKTLPGTPELSNEKVSASDDHVVVSADIDLKGADDAQLKLCYVETGKTDTFCLAPKTVTGTSFSEEIPGLDTNKTYTIVVTLDNGGETPATSTEDATTLALKVTSDTSATVKLCGDTLKVTYTATIANPDNYTYAWKVNGADSASATGNTLVVNITTAGSYKVKCVGTNITDATVTAKDSVTTTAQQGVIPSMGICTDCDAGKAYIKSVANVNNASWKLGGVEKYTYKATGTYTIESGTYTVEVKSAGGCAATYENITIDKQYTHCTVNTIRDNEMGSGTQLDSVKDHENNWYEVVQIGEGTNAQCWLAENMRAKTSPSTHSQIVMIPMVSSYSSKSAGYYENNESQYGKYGVLYNWCAAVDTFYAAGSQPELANASGHSSTIWNVTMPAGPRRGICPEGWHVPTDAEWTTMATLASVGEGYGVGTGVGKLAGGCDWLSSPNATSPGYYSYSGRNSTGFSALPAGSYDGSSFYNVGNSTLFWSSTPLESGRAYYRYFYYKEWYVSRYKGNHYCGFSVRCLRD